MNPATPQLLQLYIPLIAPFTTLVVVLVGFIYNNSRLSDWRGDLLRRIDDTSDLLRAEMNIHRAETKGEMQELRSELRGEMQELRSEVKSEMQEMRHLMEKEPGDILRLLADYYQRLTRLEDRK